MDMKFTESVTNALSSAVKDAETRHHTEVTEHHVLLAFFNVPSGYFNAVCEKLKLDPKPLINSLENKLKSLPTYSESGPTPPLSTRLNQHVIEAQNLMKKWKDGYISSDHFFYVFWEKGEDPFKSFVKNSKIPLEQVEQAIHEIRGGQTMDSPSSENGLQALKKYCKNLTMLAKEGKLP